MELFANEKQTNPQAMLADLIKLYALHYGVDGSTAVVMIERDADAFVKLGEAKAKANG